jgi:hypothetical protein
MGWVQRLVIVLFGLLGVLVAGNLRSLREGLRYLRQMRGWHPEDVTTIARDGPFGICYDLVSATNEERYRLIEGSLRDAQLTPEIIPVPGEALPNVLVRFGPDGPYTLFVAHYDKSRETPTYQGACDNTAAVSALLAAARDLAASAPAQPVALLFTSAEERGLLGAKAFCAWAGRTGFAIGGVINLDMIGRGRLATRPSALPGFYFWLPLAGTLVFDGRRVRRGGVYPLPDSKLVQRLRAALGSELVEYRRFTAYSDSNVFQEAGVSTVAVSSDDMAYLDRVWDRDSDRVELLDERNLAHAKGLVTVWEIA